MWTSQSYSVFSVFTLSKTLTHSLHELDSKLQSFSILNIWINQLLFQISLPVPIYLKLKGSRKIICLLDKMCSPSQAGFSKIPDFDLKVKIKTWKKQAFFPGTKFKHNNDLNPFLYILFHFILIYTTCLSLILMTSDKALKLCKHKWNDFG